MSTISDTMKIISKNIQYTFEELVKLLLRKTLRPALNPLNPNTKVVYNTYKGRYERGFIGSSPDDNVSKYSYIMTNDSLGWTGENLANFKVMAKFIKNNSTNQRFPSGNINTLNRLKSKSRVAFSDKQVDTCTQYNNLLSYLSNKNMQNIIANKRASFSYTADIPYTHSFKQLESIGRDIIDQTDPCIDGNLSAKMSTAMLRVKLYNLEQNLADLSVCHPCIYDSYIEMIRIINTVPQCKMVWIINLIAALTYQRWEDLPEQQQKSYNDVLGEELICAFISNELITILLQSDTSELILTASYLYPLLKMLFIVFGYSKLAPIITDICSDVSQVVFEERFKKHLDKYRGATHRRGDPLINSVGRCGRCEDNCTETEEELMEIPDTCRRPDPEPVDQCIYDFIKMFGELYPTLLGLMGGTEEFPPESIEVSCFDIPANYSMLSAIPEYLWRFNDYSYCRYLDYLCSKQMANTLNAKINAKARNLYTLN